MCVCVCDIVYVIVCVIVYESVCMCVCERNSKILTRLIVTISNNFHLFNISVNILESSLKENLRAKLSSDQSIQYLDERPHKQSEAYVPYLSKVL